MIAMWLAGCGRGELLIDDGTPPAPPVEPPPLALELTSPAQGAFAGDAPVVVSGRTTSAFDVVTVEGEVVPVATDGSFRTEVPVTGDVRVITVTSARGEETTDRRRTVYAGDDPRDSWPGALVARVTPSGLDQLTVGVAEQVDAADLPAVLAAAIPPVLLGGFTFASTSGTAGPADVVLAPDGDDLFFGVGWTDFRIAFDASAPLLPAVPVVFGVDELRIGATLALDLADDAVTLDIVDTNVELSGPILEFAGIDAGLLAFLTGGLVSAVGSALELALDLGVVPFAELALPATTLETEALGFPLALSLDQVDVDADGVAAVLGVELGGVAAVGSPHLPGVAEAPPRTDFLLSVHEGLIGALLSGDVLAAFDLGTLELPGILGEVVALPLLALPGGGELPADRTGMCITVGLPTSGVGRVHGGLEPFATLILPDLTIEAQVSTPAGACLPWLAAELAVAADLDARGSSIAIDLAVSDGAVLDYVVEGEWAEDEVIAGLGGLIDAVSVLLGSSLAIDLSTLVDPALLGGTPAITSSRAARDARGNEVPGVVVLGLTLE
jgi:hypothetical protein